MNLQPVKIKIRLTREDRQDNIFYKVFDKDGNMNETEFSMSYDEWDELKKEKVEKNTYLIETTIDIDQGKRVKWLMEPARFISILRVLNRKRSDENSRDLSLMFSLGSISREYFERFNLPVINLIEDIKLVKSVFELSIKSNGEKK